MLLILIKLRIMASRITLMSHAKIGFGHFADIPIKSTEIRTGIYWIKA